MLVRRSSRARSCRGNGVYDYACVAVLFPLLVMVGAHDPKGAAGAICRATGDVSYPLYALHWATWAVMLRLYADGWKPPLPVWFGVLAVVVAPVVAWRRSGSRRTGQAAAARPVLVQQRLVPAHGCFPSSQPTTSTT